MGILGSAYRVLDPILPFDRQLDPRFGNGILSRDDASGRGILSGPQMAPPMAPQAPQAGVMGFPAVPGPQAPQGPQASPEKPYKPSLVDMIWGVAAGYSPNQSRQMLIDADMKRRAAQADYAQSQAQMAQDQTFAAGLDPGEAAVFRNDRGAWAKAAADRYKPQIAAAGSSVYEGGRFQQAPLSPVTVQPGGALIDPNTGRALYEAPYKPETVTLNPGQVAATVSAGRGAPGDLFAALIQQESGGRPGILGPMTPYGQAQGLTQMLPQTAQAMAAKLNLPWKPELMTGTTPEAEQYQRQLGEAYFQEGMTKYQGDPRKALMYYHGGPDESLWGPQTRAYADAVLARAGGPSSQVVASGGPAPSVVTLTPQEVQAERLPPGVYQRKPDGTIVPVQGSVKDAATTEKEAAARKASIAKATASLDLINSIIPRIGRYTAGLGGTALRGVAGTPAFDLQSDIGTIKANLGFDTIAEMRANSPTGGALGSIAVQELTALQAAVASLDTSQSPEQLRRNLERVQKHYKAWLATLGGDPAAPAGRDAAYRGPAVTSGQLRSTVGPAAPKKPVKKPSSNDPLGIRR